MTGRKNRKLRRDISRPTPVKEGQGACVSHTNQEAKSFTNSLFFASIGSASLAGLYLIGLSFYNGTLVAYGLDFQDFPISTQDIYVAAYIVTKDTLVDPDSKLLPIILTAFTIVRIAAWSRQFVSPTQISALIFNITATVLTVVAVVGVAYVIPISAAAKGESQEKKNIAEFQSKGCHFKEGKQWSNCVTLVDETGKEVMEGLLVAKQNERIALFLKSGTVVLELPKLFRIKRSYAPTANRTGGPAVARPTLAP